MAAAAGCPFESAAGPVREAAFFNALRGKGCVFAGRIRAGALRVCGVRMALAPENPPGAEERAGMATVFAGSPFWTRE